MNRREYQPKEFDLSTFLLLHDRLATSVLLFMLAVGIWGLASYVRGGVLTGSLSGALLIGQALVVVQVLAGVALYLNGSRPRSSTHILYGVTAIVVLPFIWSYAKDKHPRHGLLFYSLVALFIVGLSIRGMATGS
ncbi:MAG: hypothetical protein ACRDJW_16290 [Thermomicrobiales bacterium]